MQNMSQMRSEEGRAMAADLAANNAAIAAELSHIEQRAPVGLATVAAEPERVDGAARYALGPNARRLSAICQ